MLDKFQHFLLAWECHTVLVQWVRRSMLLNQDVLSSLWGRIVSQPASLSARRGSESQRYCMDFSLYMHVLYSQKFHRAVDYYYLIVNTDFLTKGIRHLHISFLLFLWLQKLIYFNFNFVNLFILIFNFYLLKIHYKYNSWSYCTISRDELKSVSCSI